jgi:hypothetical protein
VNASVIRSFALGDVAQDELYRRHRGPLEQRSGQLDVESDVITAHDAGVEAKPRMSFQNGGQEGFKVGPAGGREEVEYPSAENAGRALLSEECDSRRIQELDS